MPSITELRNDVWIQLNEDPANPQHWKQPEIDTAIRLALTALLSVTDIAFQETDTLISDGTSKLFVPDASRVIRVDGIDGVDNCPREMSVDEADNQNGSCWRSCRYEAGVPTDKFVLDPMQPQYIYLVSPPAPDTEVTVSYIAVPTITDALVIPDHFYPMLVDMTIGRAYQRETGGHIERSQAYISAALSWARQYYGANT